MSFGSRLTKARKEKNLTQDGLGKGLGTDGKDASKAVVYGWEKDQHFPRVDQLVLICDKLGVSSDYLLFGKAVASELHPEVAEVAAIISALPPRHRAWVLQNVHLTIEAAQATLVGKDAKPAPDAGQKQEVENIPPSPIRRSA